MKIRLFIVSKKLVGAVVILIIFTSLIKLSDSLARERWKREVFTPGLQGKTVIIDPGHGGADPGAVVGKIKEADLNMDLAMALKKKLERKGVKVKLTRQGENGLTAQRSMSYYESWLILEKRKSFALENKGHMFISIHTNSNKDARASGAMVFYSDEVSKGLAEAVQNRLNLLGLKKRSIEQISFTIIKGNAMPSVLIEAGFITNKNDRNVLLSQKELLAEVISGGLEDYAQTLKPPKNR